MTISTRTHSRPRPADLAGRIRARLMQAARSPLGIARRAHAAMLRAAVHGQLGPAPERHRSLRPERFL